MGWNCESSARKGSGHISLQKKVKSHRGRQELEGNDDSSANENHHMSHLGY